MIPFDPSDPFPLLPPDAHSYREAQLHSAEVDAWLGLETEATEALILESANPFASLSDQQLWIGLPVKALLTPYTEIRTLLSQLNPQPESTIVDLGAGYGRMGFVMARHYPEVHFLGYEYVRARVLETQRCLQKHPSTRFRMEQADLSAPEFRPEPADFYFLYDYGSHGAIEKTLQDLRALAQRQSLTVVGRGRASRDAIERNHPWLSQVAEPDHYANYSIYRSST